MLVLARSGNTEAQLVPPLDETVEGWHEKQRSGRTRRTRCAMRSGPLLKALRLALGEGPDQLAEALVRAHRGVTARACARDGSSLVGGTCLRLVTPLHSYPPPVWTIHS